MKKILTVIAGIIIAGAFVGISPADTGHEGATRIERGSYVQTRAISISSSVATEFIPASFSRPDSLCKNVSAYTVHIGSAASGTVLRDIGLPIGASEYFRIDGSMTGSIHALGADGIATSAIQIRCLDGLVR